MVLSDLLFTKLPVVFMIQILVRVRICGCLLKVLPLSVKSISVLSLNHLNTGLESKPFYFELGSELV